MRSGLSPVCQEELAAVRTSPCCLAGGAAPSLEFVGGASPCLEFVGGTTRCVDFVGGTSPCLEFAGGAAPCLEIRTHPLPGMM